MVYIHVCVCVCGLLDRLGKHREREREPINYNVAVSLRWGM